VTRIVKSGNREAISEGWIQRIPAQQVFLSVRSARAAQAAGSFPQFGKIYTNLG
jgi:hypothetical protein